MRTRCNTLQHTATRCSTMQHTATHCNTLQHTTTHCAINVAKKTSNVLRTGTATHCNTMPNTVWWASPKASRTLRTALIYAYKSTTYAQRASFLLPERASFFLQKRNSFLLQKRASLLLHSARKEPNVLQAIEYTGVCIDMYVYTYIHSTRIRTYIYLCV